MFKVKVTHWDGSIELYDGLGWVDANAISARELAKEYIEVVIFPHLSNFWNGALV